jgi:hypothetical protein
MVVHHKNQARHYSEQVSLGTSSNPYISFEKKRLKKLANKAKISRKAAKLLIMTFASCVLYFSMIMAFQCLHYLKEFLF